MRTILRWKIVYDKYIGLSSTTINVNVQLDVNSVSVTADGPSAAVENSNNE